MHPERLRRRWLTFSLRTLMILLIGLALWLGRQTEKAREQREAVAMIRARGGHVVYADQVDVVDGRIQPRSGGGPWAPAWLRRRIGEDFFREVVVADLGAGEAPDDDGSEVLARVGRLGGIRLLRLGWLPLTDDALRQIRGLEHLQRIDSIGAEGVTDAGLAQVEGMPDLQSLTIASAKVGDEGLRHLRALRHLQYLDLRHDQAAITDAGLAHLAGLTGIWGLTLGGARVTDAGLDHLAGLTQLQVLQLDSPGVTEAGLTRVAEHAALKNLRLANARVTDAGLDPLKGLKGLKTLYLPGTGVTNAGLKALRQAMPGVRIDVREQLEERWQAEFKGWSPADAASLREKVAAGFPGVAWSSAIVGTYRSECYDLEFRLPAPGNPGFFVDIHGTRGALVELDRFARSNGWTASGWTD